MRNLAPHIKRKRLFIEGYYSVAVSEELIRCLLIGLGKEIGMTPLAGPIVFSPTGKGSGRHHGLGGYMAWVESGVSVYTWEDHKFFTVDIYTCKDFEVERAVEYIRRILGCSEIAFEEFRYDEGAGH